MSTLVSIILPAFNSAKYISETLETLLNQTYTNFELIITYDESTDNTFELITDWSKKDSRIILLKNTGQKNIVGALNTGLKAAKGELIARADSDDLYLPDRIEKQVNFLNNNQHINILGTSYFVFNEAGRVMKVFFPENPLIIAWKFNFNTYFCHPSVMFRKKIIDLVGLYPENYYSEDYEYFSRIVSVTKGSNLKNLLVKYRQHSENLSTKNLTSLNDSVTRTSNKYFQRFSNNLNLLPKLKQIEDNRYIEIIYFFEYINFFFRFLRKMKINYKYSFYSLDIYIFSFYFFKCILSSLWLTPYRYVKYHLKKIIGYKKSC